MSAFHPLQTSVQSVSLSVATLLMVAGTLVLSSAQVAASSDECVASIVSMVPGITRAEAKAANRYALCMRVPSLPIAGDLEQRKAACRSYRMITTSAKLKDAFEWIDHIANQFPGCETSLEVEPR